MDRTYSAPLILLIAIACALAQQGSQAFAQVTFWVGGAAGDFHDPFNWLLGTVPDSRHIVVFTDFFANAPGGEVAVTFTKNASSFALEAGDLAVSFDLMGHTYDVGANLDLNSVGILDVNNGTLTAGTILVGSHGVGVLNMGTDAVLESAVAAIGANSGTTGTVNVGGGVTWINDGLIQVGGAGVGKMSIDAGGEIDAEVVKVDAGGVISGNGLVTGEVVNGAGLVSPGALEEANGALTIAGDYVQHSDGRLQIDIVAIDDHDELIVMGTATLGGRLMPQFADGFLPLPGTAFTIVSAGLREGTFDSVFPCEMVRVVYTQDAAILEFTGVMKIGDLTCSGTVGVPDLLALLASWGPCDDPSDCPADLTGSGAVGVSDLLMMLANWG